MAIGLQFGYKPGLNVSRGVSQPMMTPMPKKDIVTNPSQTVTTSTPASQANQPQMMTYNVKLRNPSKKYSGLEKEDEELIDNSIKSTGLEGVDADILREDAIKNFIKVKQAKAFLEDREITRGKISSGEVNLGDKQSNDMAYRTSQFADIIRKEALSTGVAGVTSVDDSKIIKGVLKQRPEIIEDYRRFINGELSLSNLNRTMRGGVEVKGKFMNRLADNVAPTLQKGASSLFGVDELKKYQESNKTKTLRDVAIDDMGAFPSVIAGAATVPAKQIANLLGGKSAKVNDLVGYLEGLRTGDGADSIGPISIPKNIWFDAGKIATEIGAGAIETAAGMKLLNVGQLGALLNSVPRLSKYIAKPVLEAVGFTASQDLIKGELSDKKDYGINAGISVLTAGLGNKIKDIQISKGLKSAANKVNIKDTDDYISMTKALKNDFSNPNPLNKLKDKVDDAMSKIVDDKGVVGEKLGEMRNKMKTISYSIDNAVEDINKALKGNNIGASIVKDAKKGYKVSSKITKDSGKMAVLNEITNALNEGTSKSLGIKNKMAALDKLNQDIIYMVKTQAQGSQLGNALTKASKGFSETIENTMGGYGFSKGEYAKLSDLKNTVKALSSEGNSAERLLSKVSGAGAPEEIKTVLRQLKELGYTTDDLFSEAIVANNVMRLLLSPTEFQQALRTAYPSVPGLYELGIKGVKDAVVKPLEGMRTESKGFIPSITQGVKSLAKRFLPLKVSTELQED